MSKSAHVWSARGQRNRRWFNDSSPSPHLGQDLSVQQCLSARRLHVATHSDKTCQRKCLIFRGACSFQIIAFRGVILGSVTATSHFSSFIWFASLYPDFTVYKPDFEWFLQYPSSLKQWLGRILRIKGISIGSIKASSIFTLNCLEDWLISWLTNKSWSR